MRRAIFLFTNFGERTAAATTQPVADGPDQAIGNPQHDRDEEDTHEELPIIGEPTPAQDEFQSSDEECAEKRPDEGGAAADSRPDDALDRKQGSDIQKRHDADPGGVHCAGRCRHEGRDAEHEDAVVGDVVAHEFGSNVIVADGL